MYSIDTIVGDVLVCIDENRKAANVLEESLDANTLEMGAIITSKIADGINNVFMIAPVEKLGSAVKVASQTVTAREDCGSISKPANMLRLISILLPSWKRPVTAITPIGTQQYLQQYSEFAGVHGHAGKPVAIPSLYADSDYDLRTVTSKDIAAGVRYVKVAPQPYSMDEEGETVTNWEIPAALYRACVYKIAALTMATYENGNLMQLLNSLCLEQLGIAAQ